MIVIYRTGSWQTIPAPQDPEAAWELADTLTSQTGILHHVGRI